MCTNYVPLVADLFCYERYFILSLSDKNPADFIEPFSSRYLDDLPKIDNPYFEQMVSQVYPTELQLDIDIEDLFNVEYDKHQT